VLTVLGELLECLPDYKRAFEGHCEDGYAVRIFAYMEAAI